MCFSASASFGASAVLLVVGIATIKKVQTPSQLFFASIPILFSIQQFAEGFVWITLSHINYSYLQNIPIYLFLFFAQVLWPFWVPLSFMQLEKNRFRKKIYLFLLVIGSFASFYFAYHLLFFEVNASIIPYHIHYEMTFPNRIFSLFLSALYFLATIIPPFLAKEKRMITLGLLNLSSFIITVLFFEKYVISVWCFFGALISWEIFLIMRDLKSKQDLTKNL